MCKEFRTGSCSFVHAPFERRLRSHIRISYRFHLTTFSAVGFRFECIITRKDEPRSVRVWTPLCLRPFCGKGIESTFFKWNRSVRVTLAIQYEFWCKERSKGIIFAAHNAPPKNRYWFFGKIRQNGIGVITRPRICMNKNVLVRKWIGRLIEERKRREFDPKESQMRIFRFFCLFQYRDTMIWLWDQILTKL